MQKVVATGEWLYGGSTPTQVRIVQLDYDFWYDIGAANGQLEDGERPELNDDGYLFYVRFTPGWQEGEPFWPDSLGTAQSKPPSRKQSGASRVRSAGTDDSACVSGLRQCSGMSPDAGASRLSSRLKPFGASRNGSYLWAVRS